MILMLKIPAIMSIIAISEYMEQDATFVRKALEQLQEEFEEFKQETKNRRIGCLKI